MAPLTTTAVSVRPLTGLAEIAQHDNAWDGLVERMPRPSPYLLSRWVNAWFAEAGFESRPHVLVAERGGELVGIALGALPASGADVLDVFGLPAESVLAAAAGSQLRAIQRVESPVTEMPDGWED